MGNIFARRSGSEPGEPPVLVGSHLDTQPTGGRFDGVYGVLAGLELIRTLDEAGRETLAPIDIVVWTNEEGARFSPAMLGSGVWSGAFDLEYGLGREDRAGQTVAQSLSRIGYGGEEPCRPFPVRAAYEVHIEQGPILENEHCTIGVVTGVQGIRWYDLVLTGEPCHAGPTPMEDRRDPVRCLSRVVDRLYALTAEHGPWARVTFGDIAMDPGSRNTVPGQVVLAVDLRNPDEDVLEGLERAFHEIVYEEAGACGVAGEIQPVWSSAAVTFDAKCVEAVRKAADRLGYASLAMVSGAGHDSVYVSRVAPTSMIFVPCEGGLSHNEAESATSGDLEAGCNVLLHAVLDQANTLRAAR